MQEIQAGEPLRPTVRVPIRWKITLPFFLLAIVLAIGAALLVTRIVFDTVEERFLNQLVEAGRLSSEWMVREEQRMLESLRLFARTEGIAAALEAGDPDRLRELSLGIAVNNQAAFIMFVDPDGTVVLSMENPPGANPENFTFSSQDVIDFSDWAALQQVLARAQDQAGDKFADLATLNGNTMFYIAGPVLEPGGGLAGAVVVGTRLERLIADLREETRIQITLYDFDGETIASTFSAARALPPETISELLAAQDQSSIRRGDQLQRDVTVSNIEYEEILGPWEVRDGIDLGVLGSALPKTFLVRASNVTRVQIFVLITLTLSMILIFGIFIARLITRPLQGLVDASSRVARGELDLQLEVQSRDEIEVLTNSFNAMVASLFRSQSDLIHAYDSALYGWAKALELRDQITEGHTQRVVTLTVELARRFGFEGEDIEHIRRGALLHDIGKMGIPDAILQKPGPLTDDEWVIMRKHPLFSYELIKEIEFLQSSIDIPLYHHEKWDGKGYPSGLQGEEIPLPARIFSVIDVWDALSNDRPYRDAWPKDKVFAYLKERAGTEFDPEVVVAFIEMFESDPQLETI